MARVLTDLYSIIRLMAQERLSELKANPEKCSDTLSLLQSLVICDSIIIDARRATEWEIPRFCSRFADVFELSDIGDLWGPHVLEDDRASFGTNNEDTFLLAALAYFKVAQEMNVYLLVHPTRSEFLNSLALTSCPSAAHVAINEYERNMMTMEGARYASIDFSVPPVAEQILFLHQHHGLDIATAVNELRDSKHAKAFRQYCGEIDLELLHLSPRSSVLPLQRLVNDISKATNKWKENLDEGVRHVSRRLSLRKLWGLGKVIEALGIEDIPYRDPVLFTSRKSSLLFLNDLYRTSRRPVI